ncbi:hypothetical protein [Methylogaea oryzae]|uniref:hypothetical protein n=1 Tax=Methylogaea oryzae TaxID=1295382 RepID=UPI0006CF8715|nr:hypothetical protein [Methylogaea oryzae]
MESEARRDGSCGDALREFLRETLPDYMVPSVIMPLERLPLTPNGKIDRKALPEPEAPERELVAPRNAGEEILAGLWQEVLGVEQVGVTDNFFDLGGIRCWQCSCWRAFTASSAWSCPC